LFEGAPEFGLENHGDGDGQDGDKIAQQPAHRQQIEYAGNENHTEQHQQHAAQQGDSLRAAKEETCPEEDQRHQQNVHDGEWSQIFKRP